MSLRYGLMYRVGFVPWDTGEVHRELTSLIEGPDALSPGRALDLGCGTGTQATYLAEHGWEVTAVDAVKRAVAAARERAARAGVDVRWHVADVARLGDLGLTPGFDLLHDRGCFHDLPGSSRDGYVRGVADLAAPGATFVLMSFVANRNPGPAGADEAELRARFGDAWELVDIAVDSAAPPPGPMRNVPRRWYTFRKR